MSKYRITYFLISVLAANLFAGCITYSQSETIRMELPSVRANDRVINYKDYSDISYGEYTRQITDPEKVAYSVLYDEKHKLPRWVAYSLSSEELTGYAKRNGKQFHQDTNVPFLQADRFDYRGSGWTNGHLAPAADFTWSDSAMNDTFCYTNICPQDETLNGGSWQKLEKRIRDWAGKFGEVYIVTGPIIGKAKNGFIGANMVAVPDAFYKAILVRSGEAYQAIAFIMDNSAIKQPYTQCCVSVNDLENIIGLDLFCALDDSIEDSVESSYNKAFWGI